MTDATRDDRQPPPGWDEDGPIPGPKAEFALALSGGGYRAMLFHLGALYRLNELGLLGRLGRVSSVSGGSFAASILARAWPDLEFRDGRSPRFDKLVAGPIERLARTPADVWIVALGLLPFVDPTSLVAGLLDRGFLHGLRLDQLPDTPRFTFNAAHVATGTNWRFAKPYMGTYLVGLIPTPTTPVAVAAAASAAFPPIVSPLTLHTDPAAFYWVKGADLYDYAALRERVLLMDGGAYDNLGVESVDDRAQTLLVSDGGGNLGVDAGHAKFVLWAMQLRRVLDMAVEQGRDLRRAELVRRANAHEFRLALWRTVTDPAKFKVPLSAFVVPQEWRTYLATRPTRMWPMSRRDQAAMIDWGYLASDLVLRTYVTPEADPPTALPRGTDFSAPVPRKAALAGPPADPPRSDPRQPAP
jgi:NTE family protein